MGYPPGDPYADPEDLVGHKMDLMIENAMKKLGEQTMNDKQKQKVKAYMKAGYTEHFIAKYRKEHVGDVTPEEIRQLMQDATIDEDKNNPEYEDLNARAV